MAGLTVEQLMEQYDKQGCLHEQFIKQAKNTPQTIAVVTHDGKKVTYEELNDMTDILARKLRHLGVKINTVVGILMDRCLEYTVSYIAILKAGGAYMPLEVSYPPSLLQSVLEDARPIAVCSKLPFSQHIDANTVVVHLDNGWQKEFGQLPAFRDSVPVHLDDMAYTAYSSGTTGKPKGIQCPHRGAVFSYYWRHVAYPYGEDEREACNVFFVWEMLRPLLKGVTLYIIPDDVIYDPPQLVQFLTKNRITRMLFTPSLLQAVLDFKGLHLNSAFSSMRQIWFCGEVVTMVLRNRFEKHFPHVQLLNLYSISECHDISCADLSAGKLSAQPRKFCPVGKLIPGVHIVVMDQDLNVKPIGVKGEVYVGGPALAIGYLNQPTLNAERFITRPDHVPAYVGDRLYRTGDWGYVLSDGNLEVVGRCDSVVKIRGYTIETQAVEAALLELPMVNSGCVLTRGEEGSDKYLVAYIVPEGKTSQKEVREALKKHLPFYMIPSRFIFIKSLPILEASGKLNKKALPEDNDEDSIDPLALPSTPTERQIAAIWCSILKLNNIDIQENFFDLGGHSLLATQLVSEMNSQLGLQLSSSDLFMHSTVASMAKFIDNPTNAEGGELNLMKEVNKHSQIKPILDVSLRAFWRSHQLSKASERHQKIFITGATGYVGAFILKELLHRTEAIIFCLVRENPELSAFDRICQSFSNFGIMSTDLLEKLKKRVTTMTGDVSLLNLGLSDADYTYLACEVDSIIHAAAFVNLIYPYHALYSSNVLGTENIVKFAMENKIKSLHHISTDAVFPQGLRDCAENEDMSKYANKLTTGYAQTKWVAEQLVLAAQEKGLPVAIYRCGNVGGSTKEASWNPADSILLMIQGCLYTMTAPDIDWQLKLTPVDFVSEVIVSLSQQTQQSIGKIFHIINRHKMDSKLLWNLLKIKGYKLNTIKYSEWYENVKSAAENNKKLSNLLYLLDSLVKSPEFFSEYSTFTQTNLQGYLEEFSIKYPRVDDVLMGRYLEMLPNVDLIPYPSSKLSQQVTRELQRKVVLVTGASSGIGAAIAEILALAGAKVAAAARRTDKLQDLKSKVEKQGGAVYPVTMDVCSEKQVNDAVSQVESQLGPINILVNNAAVLHYSLMKNLHLKDWNQMVDVNVKGVLNCTAAVLGGMVQRKQGHIVNISSDGGRKGFSGLAVYCGTKYFIEGMSQSLRQEMVEFGVKVTCIQPGDVRTQMFEKMTNPQAEEIYDVPPTMKILEPKDIAHAVLYAVSQPEHCAVNEILVEPRETPI
ncbi:hypothetical protein L9F63_017318 [Diploptera punctata]|uniref:Fatty acid synthase n=1 Tax=Diploptera punctata TaxID=6984 RepID=A0AAD8A092_DIPPU|nr:hypothetical protein L9F63_017318 [Diploptera punctata]